MKILQVVHSFGSWAPGGTEVYTELISHALSGKHRVDVFHRTYNPDLKEYAIHQTRQGNVDIFSINNSFRAYASFAHTYSDPAIDATFGRLLDELHPDVVHIQHLMHLSTGIVEEAKQRNIPVVLTLHDYWLLCPQGQRFKNNSEVCNNACLEDCVGCVGYQLSVPSYAIRLFHRNLPRFCIEAGRRFYQAQALKNSIRSQHILEERRKRMKAVCALIDRFLAPSQFIRDQFIEAGVPKEKIIHLPHGYPAAQNKEKSESACLRFAFIGNLLPAKGTHILIESFNQLRDEKATLKIFGQEGSYKSKVLDYPRRLRRSAKNKNISFQPVFDHSLWQEVFRDIDVLVVPSLWHENTPLVILEALATGTPVLATNTGGIPELLTDGQGAWLVQPGDAQDLLNKIRLLINTPAHRQALKAAPLSAFSLEHHVQELEKIYTDLIS